MQFIVSLRETNRSNPFFDRVYLMLFEAVRLYEEKPGDAFQIFYSYYLSLRIGLMPHSTLPDFLKRCTEIACLSSPDIGEFPQTTIIQEYSMKNFTGGLVQRTGRESIRDWGYSYSLSNTDTDTQSFSIRLSDLFPSFRRLNNLDESIKVFPSLGRFIKRDIKWMETNVLSNGDTIYPTNKSNPGFDFMTVLNGCFVDDGSSTTSQILPFVMLIECKYSDPFYNVKLPYDQLDEKLRVLMKPTSKGGYNNDQNQFQCGTLTVPWKQVIYLFVSAHEIVGLMDGKNVSSSSPVLDFDGTILVSGRKRLCESIGSPLNNFGLFLHPLPPRSSSPVP